MSGVGDNLIIPSCPLEENLILSNKCGILLYPMTDTVKAIVCFCHGYGDTCTFFFEGFVKKLATSGYGVFAMDYPGLGLSEGLHCYIPCFDRLVDDVIEHYSKIKGV